MATITITWTTPVALGHSSNEDPLRQERQKQRDLVRLEQTPQYQQGLKERYKIERKFGEAKQGHGLGRCRYLGKAGFAVQAFLVAITLNLKRIVKLLTGLVSKCGSSDSLARMDCQSWLNGVEGSQITGKSRLTRCCLVIPIG